MSAFAGYAGLILAGMSFFASFASGSLASPYFVVAIFAIGLVGAFMFGYSLRELSDRASARADARVERVVSKAVDEKMAEIEGLVDERIDACFKMDGTSLYIETPKYRREREEREDG